MKIISCLISCAVLLSAPELGAETLTARQEAAAKAMNIRSAAASKPHSIDGLAVYEVKSPDTVAGAGFLIEHEGKTFGVTAAHPHADVAPTHFTRASESLALGPLVQDAEDIRIYSMPAPSTPSFHPIAPGGRILANTDRLIVLTHDGPQRGILFRPGRETGDVLLVPGEPVDGLLDMYLFHNTDLAGNSGAPIILSDTGEVFGVLEAGTEDFKKRTIAQFRVLEFPMAPSGQNVLPETIFGTARKKGTITDPKEPVLPAEVFGCWPGMPLLDLFGRRPFLSPQPDQDLRGTRFTEFLGASFLFDRADFICSSASCDEMHFNVSRTRTNPDRIETAARWLTDLMGDPAECYSLDPSKGFLSTLMKPERRPKGAGTIAVWKTQKALVVFDCTTLERDKFSVKLEVLPVSLNVRDQFDSQAVQPLEAGPTQFLQELHKVVRATFPTP